MAQALAAGKATTSFEAEAILRLGIPVVTLDANHAMREYCPSDVEITGHSMKTHKRPSITPGYLLLEEFLIPMGISQYRLAKEIGVPPQRISEIVAGKRAITADTDLRLCRFFRLSNGYWLRAQIAHDTEVAQDALAKALAKIKPWTGSNPKAASRRMKVNYDGKTDILTVVFRNSPVAESDEEKPGVILDYDAAGNIVSIEVLDASRRVEEPHKVTIETDG